MQLCHFFQASIFLAFSHGAILNNLERKGLKATFEKGFGAFLVANIAIFLFSSNWCYISSKSPRYKL